MNDASGYGQPAFEGENAAGETAPAAIVGIGASAGGIEALEQFFRNMPPDSGATFVVVQHLSPDFRSMMDELLGRWTRMRVYRVEDGMRVEPDTVYLIPPRKQMILSAGRLLLADTDPAEQVHLPIDTFFRSLAREAGSDAIGIILSGSGSDGSRGAIELRDAGALVLVQRPESASFDSMPRNAVDAGAASEIVDPEGMPEVLLARLGRPLPAKPPAELADGMAEVFRLLQGACGIDFSHYKSETVTRRIERRIAMLRSADLDAYIERLRDDREELNALYRDLLIGVTRFFRDPEFFEYLADELLPPILEAVPEGTEFRVWVAACATGEEAYSLAIILHEILARNGRDVNVKIFATDVHEASLERAGAGEYPPESLEGMDAERRERYFTQSGLFLRVIPELRKMVVFAPQNLLRDPPFRAMDLITCRNLLIYLKPEAQHKVVSLLHFALKPGGTLFLGSSESPAGLQDGFEILQSRFKVYRKRRSVPARLPLPALAGRGIARHGDGGDGGDARLPLGGMIKIYDALLARFMPPGFLINRRRELLHTFGGAGRWLTQPDGRPSRDLLDLLVPQLKVPVSAALQTSLKEGRPAVVDTPARDDGGEPLRIGVQLLPAREQDNAGCLLVTVEVHESGGAGDEPPVEAPLHVVAADASPSQLERELRYTQASLQATVEELETSNEELQATNEELMASNEELQSTNEELQSVNEELYTVNAELQRKITELSELTADMDNLLASTEVGTIFLDRELCLRRITPKISETFSLLPQDLGRRIEGFTYDLRHAGLMDDLNLVLDSGRRIEREVRDRAGRWFFLRILPYRSAGAVAGVVLTLVDIDTLKAAENALFRERHLLRSLMDTLPDSVYFRDLEGRLVLINKALAARAGLPSPEQAAGRRPEECLPPRLFEEMRRDELIMAGGEPVINRVECVATAHGGCEWLLSTKLPLHDREGRLVGMFSVARDISEQKRAQDAIQRELERRDEFIAMLSHELRNPLAAIYNAAQILGMDAAAPEMRARSAEVVGRQAAQMARLMDDLLDVSRLSHGKIELRREVFELGPVLADALSGIRPLAEQRSLTLHQRMPAEPLCIDGDPARIQQVVANLLHNAVRYNRDGGEVHLEAVDRGDGYVCIAVRDTGVGISAELLPRVFDVFVQGERGPRGLDAGLGIGLALVRAIAELHDGHVSVASDGPEQGTVIEVVLPLSDVLPPEAVEPAPVMDADAGIGAKTVLLVEDGEDNRRLLTALLETAGYRVHEAATGEEGLDMALHLRPPQVLMDIGLPGIDGYEVARRLRERLGDGTPRLIALTGFGQPADRDQARASGFDAFLVKPVTLEQLTGVLQQDI